MLNCKLMVNFTIKSMTFAENEQEIMRSFKLMADDQDGTGSVSLQELKSIMTTVGDKLTQEEFHYLLEDAKLDISEDRLNYRSFVHRMMKR